MITDKYIEIATQVLPDESGKGAETMLSADVLTSHTDVRIYASEMLDSIRTQEQSLAVTKARFMALAHHHGLSFAEIGEHLDMSGRAVKRAIRRAAGTPGMEAAA